MRGNLRLLKNNKITIFILIVCLSIIAITTISIVINNKIKDMYGKGKNVLQSENISEKAEETKEELKSDDNLEKQTIDDTSNVESKFIEKIFIGRTTEVVNFRATPSITASIISKLDKKTIVEVLGIEGEWSKVKFKSKEGWINSKYLTEYTDADKKADEEIANKQKNDAENKQKKAVQIINNTSNDTQYKKGFKNPAFANSRQIVLVTAANMNTSYCNIKFYQKSDEVWNVRAEVNGRIGTNGLEYIDNRRQSTDKTPAGILNIISAFGIDDNPGSKYRYTKVTGNMYWDLNSGSSTYNRLIYSNPGGDFEHLLSYPTQYKYFLLTDYNYSQVPDKGGAIFLHVNGNEGTGGCISMPESYMRDLITWIDPSQNPKILIIPSRDLGKYWY